MTRIAGVVVLAALIVVAKCFVLNDKDIETSSPEKSREKRSCHVCEFDNGPPPPGLGHPPPGFGPPPFFHTMNWSGVSRGTNGVPLGAYSGASAAASSQALTSHGYGGQEQQNQFGNSGQPSSGSTANSQAETNSFGAQSGQNSIGSSNGYESARNSRIVEHEHSLGQGSQGFAGQQQTNGFGGAQSNSAARANSGGLGNEQQVQSLDNGFGQGQKHHHHHEKYQGAESFKNENEQQIQSSGSGQWEQGGFGSGSQFGNSGASSGATSGAQSGSHGAGSGREALGGALKLASEGLQTASQAGCSTCGHSSYALSNAKSKSGNAVAVSIGR